MMQQAPPGSRQGQEGYGEEEWEAGEYDEEVWRQESLVDRAVVTAD